MHSLMTEIRKGEDQGEVVIDHKGKPICSIHGRSLWIEEKNVEDNSAFCLSSDKTIYASDNVRLSDSHISIKNTPVELDKLSAGLHESAG